MRKICCVGSGFSGAVIGRELAERGYKFVIVDDRNLLAGNCHTYCDGETGIMVHGYGPHIFHTGDKEVWDYVCRFGKMMPYTNRVKATVKGEVYFLPINFHTINQFFKKAMSPAKSEQIIKEISCSDIETPQTFEEQGLRFVGEDLYCAFFDGYTRKQWGVEPNTLPASILKRLPLRFNYDDNYFNHPFQGMPKEGYSDIVSRILNHENIELRLRCSFENLNEDFTHVFYSGPLDRYFSYDLGALSYRTLDFEEVRQDGDVMGTAVMNFPDRDVPYMRISEHKYFAPWECDKFEKSVAYKEYTCFLKRGDISYYPIRRLDDKQLLDDYTKRADELQNVTFVGRLGTYRYLDMDVTIREAIDTAKAFVDSQKTAI